jgi:anaerobic selenocysteine-containing dehydrogenase
MMIDEKPTEEQLDRLENFYGFKVPRKHGYDVVRAIKAIHEEKIKVMFCMGGNFLSATPDTTYTANALRKLNLLVCVSTKLNRGHLVHGKEALILPTYGRSDKDIVNGEIQIITQKIQWELFRVQKECWMLFRITSSMKPRSYAVWLWLHWETVL